MTRPLSPKDQDALASLFMIFWAATVLNPRGHQSLRWTMVKLGLVKRRGTLALTARGERVIALIKRPADPQ